MEAKAKKRKHDHHLLHYHSLPGYLKDNEFILGSYRSEWPLKQTFLSVFCIHNETLNVWTHLIGFFIFLCLTIYTAAKVPNFIDLHTQLQQLSDILRRTDLPKLLDCLPPDWLSGSLHVSELLTKCMSTTQLSTINQTHDDSALPDQMKDEPAAKMAMIQQPITRWPLFAFMGGAMFCLLASSGCHLLSCHSERLRYVMLRIDYVGISALIATSFYPPVYYSFICQPFFCCLYLAFITVLGVGSMAFSLHPSFQKPYFRGFRASLFFAMGMSGVGPVIHKLVLYGNQAEAIQTTVYEVVMGFLYGIGAYIYVLRVPEKWMPGKFDIVCSSHQVFHVLVVAGAYTHYRACLIYLKWKDAKGC